MSVCLSRLTDLNVQHGYQGTLFISFVHVRQMSLQLCHKRGTLIALCYKSYRVRINW